MSQSDSNLSWGHYAFTPAWNSSFKASALIKCQSDVFRIIWHRSTSLCVSSSNWKNQARVAFTFMKNIRFFLFYISYACHAFLLAINATFDFFLSCEKHQISKRITHSGLPVTESWCLREQIFLFLCNMQTVQAYTYMYTSTQRFQEYAQIKRSRASDKEW